MGEANERVDIRYDANRKAKLYKASLAEFSITLKSILEAKKDK